jgi:hypothetical protein
MIIDFSYSIFLNICTVLFDYLTGKRINLRMENRFNIIFLSF